MEVSEADIAAVMGAIVQVRAFGGCIGLAVCSALLCHWLEVNLQGMITGFEIVRTMNADGYAFEDLLLLVTALGALEGYGGNRPVPF